MRASKSSPSIAATSPYWESLRSSSVGRGGAFRGAKPSKTYASKPGSGWYCAGLMIVRLHERVQTQQRFEIRAAVGNQQSLRSSLRREDRHTRYRRGRTRHRQPECVARMPRLRTWTDRRVRRTLRPASDPGFRSICCPPAPAMVRCVSSALLSRSCGLQDTPRRRGPMTPSIESRTR